MNSIDQEPIKRRKLGLNKKTPTRFRGSLRFECTPRSAHIPIPKKSLRNLRNVCQNIESSDESSLEIGWDNNSPSPSTCAKQAKRKGNAKKNDISAMLKKVPRKKKTDVKEGQSNVVLKTWMQDDLAVSTYSAEKTIKKSNRKSRIRSQRRGAITFNEELKTFIEKVVHSGESNIDPLGSTPQRRAPHIGGQSKDSMSPNSLNVSPIDAPLYDSPIDAPLYDSPVNPPLIADNLDNINWSYLDTPAIKKTCQMDNNNTAITDNIIAKNASCKTLYENDSCTSKPISCKTLYTANNVHIETITTNPTCEILYKVDTDPDDNSLMNINFDDDLEVCKSVLCTALPDTIPVVSDFSSCKVLFKECPAYVDNIIGKTTSCKTLNNHETVPGDNSLMNIDFDDDLDEMLYTQSLDLKTTGKDEISMKLVDLNTVDNGVGINVLVKECPSNVTDDKALPIMDEKDVSMLIEDPMMEENDVSMLFEDPILEEKDASMLLDDNFSDVIHHLDNNNGKKDNSKCNMPPLITEKVANSALINSTKVVTICTPNLNKPTVDLIGFDDADDLFDDIIVSLDGAVKCKSQETPPQSITSDQRKMKNRCHTSPFPLTSKRTLLKNDNKNIEDTLPTLNNTDKKCATNKHSGNAHNIAKGKDFKEGTLKTPPDKSLSELNEKHLESKSNTLKKSDQISFEQNGQTLNPHSNTKNVYSFKTSVNASKYEQNTVGTLPLDLSIIGKKQNRIEEDVSICISSSDTKTDLFTSTQKCSINEIQRKREDARLKLKQKNRWKK